MIGAEDKAPEAATARGAGRSCARLRNLQRWRRRA